MSAPAVLFDELGPRAKRRARIVNIVAALAVLGLIAVVLLRLGDQGQLQPHLWVNALNGTAWVHYLLIGLQFTLQAAAISVVTSLALGLILGFLRLMPFAPVRAVCMVIVEFFRAVPVLVLMVFFYSFFSLYAAPTFIDARDAPYFAVITALTLYNGSVIAELVRSGVRSLPKGQREAAYAVGMTPGRSLRLVEIPQALVAMMPSMLSQFVIILKDSALGYIIGYAELLRYATQLGSGYGNILQALVVVGVIFILLNFLLTWFAQILARRLSSRTSGDVSVGPAAKNKTLVA